MDVKLKKFEQLNSPVWSLTANWIGDTMSIIYVQRYLRILKSQSNLKHGYSSDIIQHARLCVFSLSISPVMIERKYMLCLIIIVQSEVWTITHCLGLVHETMVCAVCLCVFLWISDMFGLLRGTIMSWWYFPRIWPSVTDMQHYYRARYPTDDWHLAYMFSLVYFSLEVCLVGVFPHFVSTRRNPCVMVYAPLPLASPLTRKQNSNRGWPGSLLDPTRGHLNLRMGLPALLGGDLCCWIV